MSSDPLAGLDLATITITISDCRVAGYCPAGVRGWWRRQNMPIQFADFLRTGMSADAFLTGGDHHARDTIEKKILREGLTSNG